MKSEKLYVCLEDRGILSLHSRIEVDNVIKTVEESPDQLMPFTIVGNITIPCSGKPYLFIYQLLDNKNSTLYDTIVGENEEDAKRVLLSKKKITNKSIKVLATKDLTRLITDYYE